MRYVRINCADVGDERCSDDYMRKGGKCVNTDNRMAMENHYSKLSDATAREMNVKARGQRVTETSRVQ